MVTLRQKLSSLALTGSLLHRRHCTLREAPRGRECDARTLKATGYQTLWLPRWFALRGFGVQVKRRTVFIAWAPFGRLRTAESHFLRRASRRRRIPQWGESVAICPAGWIAGDSGYRGLEDAPLGPALLFHGCPGSTARPGTWRLSASGGWAEGRSSQRGRSLVPVRNGQVDLIAKPSQTASAARGWRAVDVWDKEDSGRIWVGACRSHSRRASMRGSIHDTGAA